MNWTLRLMTGLLAVGLLAGCQMSKGEQTGTGVGALAGAGLGAALDGGNPWRGALIGGVAGGLLGNVVGGQMERSNQTTSAPPPSQPQTGTSYDGGKFCPECGRVFNSQTNFCPVDGQQLRSRNP